MLSQRLLPRADPMLHGIDGSHQYGGVHPEICVDVLRYQCVFFGNCSDWDDTQETNFWKWLVQQQGGDVPLLHYFSCVLYS